MKLLSPAGNFTSLKTAVFFGADEVYLGVNEFNARNNVDGFTLDNLESAVDFCHLYGVKVCLAINILFKTCELERALTVVKTAFSFGVDYFIVQDLGLASLIKKHIPSAILHASTQMAVHNLEGVLALLPYGFKRVVLARETPLEEIKRIKQNTDIEIEYFVHGALCVSFSGNCYLSSYLFNASGNRGVCKQLCRLPYELYHANKKMASGYLLSAKDFDLSDKLNELLNAGVDFLKIEGRARRPFYVGEITKFYRNLLNKNDNVKSDKLLAFNRGFTPAYFNGNGNIISKIQSHVGEKIGKITKVITKKTYKEVYFTSRISLSPKSTFKTFIGEKENAVITAFDLKKISENNYLLTTTANVSMGEEICLIIDYEKEKNILDFSKKVKIDIALSLEKDLPIKADFVVNGTPHTVFGETLSLAKSSPLTIDELKENFTKSEYFDCNLSVNLTDNLFLAKKQLNAFRREVFDEIYRLIVSSYKRTVNDFNFNLNNELKNTNKNSVPLKDFVYIDEFSKLSDISNKNVIYSPEFYRLEDIKEFKNACENLGKTPILDLPNFATHKDVLLLKNIIESLNIKYIANNYYALNFNAPKVIGPALNIYNNITKNIFNSEFLTAEQDYSSIAPYPYMTFRHCPYKNHQNADCKNCPHDNKYYYLTNNGKKLKLKRKKLSSCTFYLTD
jgi:putative protease